MEYLFLAAVIIGGAIGVMWAQRQAAIRESDRMMAGIMAQQAAHQAEMERLDARSDLEILIDASDGWCPVWENGGFIDPTGPRGPDAVVVTTDEQLHELIKIRKENLRVKQAQDDERR